MTIIPTDVALLPPEEGGGSVGGSGSQLMMPPTIDNATIAHRYTDAIPLATDILMLYHWPPIY